MSSLQVDNINPYLSSSVTIGGGGINTENLTFINFESPSQGQLVIKQRDGNGYASIGMENQNENIDIYSYDLTSSLSIGNNNGFKYQIQYPDDPTQYHQLQFDPNGILYAPSSNMGGQGKFTLTANSGIHQYQPDDITITDQTGSFDVRNGNFFTTLLTANVDNRFEFSELDGGQTINILVSTNGTATVSFDNDVVKQPDGFSYTPSNGTAKDILTFISFDDTTLYLVAVKNLV
jgi:hypothetical protein